MNAKILIVDDSEAVRAKLRNDLQNKGYDVVEAGDGFLGLEQAQQHTDLKLVICDINMPRMDGLTMSQQLRDLPAFKTIPILIMTTEATPAMKAKGKEAGVLAWVTKPYVAEKLLAAVAKIVGS